MLVTRESRVCKRMVDRKSSEFHMEDHWDTRASRDVKFTDRLHFYRMDCMGLLPSRLVSNTQLNP